MTGAQRFRRGLARWLGHYLQRRGRNTSATSQSGHVLGLLAWALGRRAFFVLAAHSSKPSPSAFVINDEVPFGLARRAAAISASAGGSAELLTVQIGLVMLIGGHGQERSS